jgi:hypothetical protein
VRGLLSIFLIVVLFGVVDAEPTPGPGPGLITVFLSSGTTDEQRQAIDSDVRALPGVRRVEYESRELAWARFQRQFRDAPDLIAATKMESLPESFRLTVADGACAEAYLAALEDRPGVSDVFSVPAETKHLPAAYGYVVQVAGYISDHAAIDHEVAGLLGPVVPVHESAAGAADRLARCGVPFERANLSASLRYVWRPRAGAGGTPPVRLDGMPGVVRSFIVPVQAL